MLRADLLVMTALKLALADLAMWVRDRYFPSEYANATWQRLVPYFRLPGRIVSEADTLTFEPRVFNDRRLNRDLAAMCERFSESRSRLPGGWRVRVPSHQGTDGIEDVPRKPVA